MLNECIDELSVYRGKDFIVSGHIRLRQPTVGEVEEYGERDYYSMVYQLTSTPQSMKSQLWDMGVDYTKITSYELFYSLIFKLYPQDKTSIIFGDLSLPDFQVMRREDNDAVVLFQRIGTENVIMDEFTYEIIVDYLRKAHYIIKDERMPANESTKMILIEDAKEELQRNKNKEYHSVLKNYVSAMVNSAGFKYNHEQVWDMKINAFMDSVMRIGRVKRADLLMQSGYSGFGVDLKKIDKKELDWLGELS